MVSIIVKENYLFINFLLSQKYARILGFDVLTSCEYSVFAERHASSLFFSCACVLYFFGALSLAFVLCGGFEFKFHGCHLGKLTKIEGRHLVQKCVFSKTVL